MKLRRLNKDDQKAIVAKAKSLCRGRIRVEFKDADQIEPPIAGCPFFCKPMGSTVDDFDSCSETLLRDVKIPDVGEFWVDVQVALNEEPVGYEPSYEPAAWFKAIFKDGRLVEVTR
jgi:hypothetical protein